MLPVNDVDFSTLTHIMVGRITPRTDGGLNTNFDIDDVQGPAMAKALAQHAHAANRKAILMLGGAGEHDGFVGAASNANRAKFVQNC
jgi:chitinase